MKKYYPTKEMKFIERNEVMEALNDADNTPAKHIRVVFNDEKKKISFYNDEEYEIQQAVVFLWTDGSLFRCDFDTDEEASGKHLCIMRNISGWRLYWSAAKTAAVRHCRIPDGKE